MKKSRGFGFGIVGCGMIANFHARAIGDIRGARVVACFDAVPAAADRFAASQGCRAYHALKDMLADPDVDVVTVGTPSGAHLEPAVAAARAGKHVIVEKPLEITLRRCDQIIRECEKHKVKLSAIFPSRFHQSSIELKRAAELGRFGRLTLGEAYVKWYRTQAYYDSGAWRGTWELEGLESRGMPPDEPPCHNTCKSRCKAQLELSLSFLHLRLGLIFDQLRICLRVE